MLLDISLNGYKFQKSHKNIELRFQNPERYRKLAVTKQLIDDGVDPANFKAEGGLSLNAYKTFNDILDAKQSAVEEVCRSPQSNSISSELLNSKSLKEKRNVLVLLVDFDDKPREISREKFEEKLFSTKNDPPLSVREYYQEVSSGNFDIDGEVHGWYRADHDYCYYSDDLCQNSISWTLPHSKLLVKEVLNKAKGDVDFNKFAANGKLSTLIVVFAGIGGDDKFYSDCTNSESKHCFNLYPHHAKLDEPVELEAGVTVDSYILMHELPIDDVGGYCHEIGHNLGLPDLYISDHSSTVVGRWCLMALGDRNGDGKSPSHLNPWCKIHLGWAKPTVVTGKLNNYTIPNEPESPQTIYRIDIENSEGEEYFLVENRQKTGFDSALPGSGLLIWHVNESKSVGHFPNNDPENFFLTLKQADGLNDLETRIKPDEKPPITETEWEGDPGDAYPGNTENRKFDHYTNPSSKSYSGKASCVSVISISDPKPSMEAVIGVECKGIPAQTQEPGHLGDGDASIYAEGYRCGYKTGYNQAVQEFKRK